MEETFEERAARWKRLHDELGDKMVTIPRKVYYNFRTDGRMFYGICREVGYRTGIDLVDRRIDDSDESLSKHPWIDVDLPWWFKNSVLCESKEFGGKPNQHEKYYVHQFRKSKTHHGKKRHAPHPYGGWDRWLMKALDTIESMTSEDGYIIMCVRKMDEEQ